MMNCSVPPLNASDPDLAGLVQLFGTVGRCKNDFLVFHGTDLQVDVRGRLMGRGEARVIFCSTGVTAVDSTGYF